MDREKQAVIDVVLTMTKAFNHGDIDGIKACYQPTATVVFDPGTVLPMGPELCKLFSQAFDLKPDFRYETHQVFFDGDTALHLGSWTMTGVAADGSPMSEKGLAAQVLRRDASGRWLLAIDNPHSLAAVNH